MSCHWQKALLNKEVEARQANIQKKRVTALEDSRNIHRMLIPQMRSEIVLYWIANSVI